MLADAEGDAAPDAVAHAVLTAVEEQHRVAGLVEDREMAHEPAAVVARPVHRDHTCAGLRRAWHEPAPQRALVGGRELDLLERIAVG